MELLKSQGKIWQSMQLLYVFFTLQAFICCEGFSHNKWGNGLENILTANSVSIWVFQRFFFSEVPINSLHMPSLAWIIWNKILTPWSCQQSCHRARYLAQAVLTEIYPVLIAWVPWGISVFASKSWGKITWRLWKWFHSANEKCKYRKLKNNIYVQHCLDYDYIYPKYEK